MKTYFMPICSFFVFALFLCDQSFAYKYNSRTGLPGHRTYNYDVSGDGVYGDCDMKGKYGYCTVTDDYGNEISGDAEWVNKGVIEIDGDDGNSYEVEVD